MLHYRKCLAGSFNTSLVKGKIVLCDRFAGYSEAKKAGAAGSILKSVLDKVSFVVSFPASALSSDNYNSIISYINTTKYLLSLDEKFLCISFDCITQSLHLDLQKASSRNTKNWSNQGFRCSCCRSFLFTRTKWICTRHFEGIYLSSKNSVLSCRNIYLHRLIWC